MSGYREHRFYSTELDTEAARLSMADDTGQEYYAIVERGSGKAWRETRDWALTCIQDAIAMGWPPGLVAIRAMPAVDGLYHGERT